MCSERETSKITVLLFHKTIILFVKSQTTLAHGRVAHGGLLTQQLVLSSHNDPPRNAASCFLGLEAYLGLVFYSFKS